ncbi:MAG TPA: SDR family oxidoreductase [bacterium]|nr:SDR family oxidoreductase [bacterium]
MPETVLVTGANRGIGFAVAKVYAESGDKVFAACRQPEKAEELKKLQKSHPGLVEPVALEVDSDDSVQAAAKVVAGKSAHLDALINMAGIMPGKYDSKLEDLDFKYCREAYETNVLGCLRTAKFFLPLLRKAKGARIVNVTSGLGSISGTDNPNFYAYGASKSALNKVSRTLAFELKKDNIVCVALDPGWVKTDMGGPNAWLTPEQSSTAIVKTVKGLTMDRTSLFIYNDGKELNW